MGMYESDTLVLNSIHQSATHLQPDGAGAYLLCRLLTFKLVYWMLHNIRFYYQPYMDPREEEELLEQGHLRVDASEW